MSEAGEAVAGGLHGRHGWALQSPKRTVDARRRSRGTVGTAWEWRHRSRGTAGTHRPTVTSMAPVCSCEESKERDEVRGEPEREKERWREIEEQGGSTTSNSC